VKQTLCLIVTTTIGVILAIYAAESKVRLDWPETALIAGAVLVTVGIMQLKEMKGEEHDDF
jgi:hypothetical protein